LGQLSGKPQPASAYVSMVPRSKHNGADLYSKLSGGHSLSSVRTMQLRLIPD